MIYLFDNTKEGFLTAFTLSYGKENVLFASEQTQIPLGEMPVSVETDLSLAARAERRFAALDRGCLRELDLLMRSGQSDHMQIARDYFALIAERGGAVRGMLNRKEVISATECVRKVSFEIHRMHGFVRFMESESSALYAPISPDNDICDLVAPHFLARIPAFPFVIHDVVRKKAAVYDGTRLFLAPLERAEIVLSADESGWRELWKHYYRDVNIPERERLRQMRGYLPVRYRKHMTEFH